MLSEIDSFFLFPKIPLAADWSAEISAELILKETKRESETNGAIRNIPSGQNNQTRAPDRHRCLGFYISRVNTDIYEETTGTERRQIVPEFREQNRKAPSRRFVSTVPNRERKKREETGKV